MRDPQADSAGGGNFAGRRNALRPKPQRRANQKQRQDAGDHHQLEPEARRNKPEGQRPVAIAIHRANGCLILVIGMGEKLDRFDIGDRIDNLPSYPRPRGGAAFGLGAYARQVIADEQQIADEPDAKHSAHTPIDRENQKTGRDDRRQRKNDGVDGLDSRLGQRPRGLHLLLGDAAREIIVEKRHVLTKRPAMQARENQNIEVRVQDDRLKRRRHSKQERAHQDHEAGDGRKKPTVGLK